MPQPQTFNGHVISTKAIAARQENMMFSATQHAALLDLMAASKKKIVADPELLAALEELKQATLYCDRRRNYSSMKKCPEDNQCAWCAEPGHEWRAKNVYKFLHARNMKFPSVVPATANGVHAGHNEPWLVVKAMPPKDLPKPDEYQPSVIKAGLG